MAPKKLQKLPTKTTIFLLKSFDIDSLLLSYVVSLLQ